MSAYQNIQKLDCTHYTHAYVCYIYQPHIHVNRFLVVQTEEIVAHAKDFVKISLYTVCRGPMNGNIGDFLEIFIAL